MKNLLILLIISSTTTISTFAQDHGDYLARVKKANDLEVYIMNDQLSDY